MGTLFTALGAAAALAGTDIIPVHQGGARAVGLTGAQLLTYVGGTYLAKAGGTMTGALTIASGTLTASAPALSITQTWNAGAVGFVGALIDITNTASAGASYPLIIKVGGISMFEFTKAGRLNSVQVSTGILQCTYADFGSSGDTLLYRDAAATLAQRNGTTAQRMHIYRSYTDGSNYSRLALGWNTSTALLMAEGLGTGTDGNIAFNDAALATSATRGYIMVPSAAGISTGVPADIPTGQTPIVFDSTNKKIGAYTGGAWVWTAALA